MSLKDIQQQLQKAQEMLAPLVEEETQAQTGQAVMYLFVYEQQYKDAPGWGPNYQQIQARDIEQAFCILGRVIQEMSLTVRDIRYGYWDEMLEEIDRISDYWHEHHKAKKRG